MQQNEKYKYKVLAKIKFHCKLDWICCDFKNEPPAHFLPHCPTWAPFLKNLWIHQTE